TSRWYQRRWQRHDAPSCRYFQELTTRYDVMSPAATRRINVSLNLHFCDALGQFPPDGEQVPGVAGTVQALSRTPSRSKGHWRLCWACADVRPELLLQDEEQGALGGAFNHQGRALHIGMCTPST